jgi:hypothetical protein
VKTFRYVLDPLCLLACSLYAINRWLIEPVCKWPFLHEHFDDLLLIPAALPVVLGLQRWIGLRNHDRPPSLPEIVGHFLIRSLVAEALGPFIFPWTVGDALDVTAYSLGALAGAVWWNRSTIAGWIADALRPSATARFDSLAKHYDWMESLLAGAKLEKCRNAFWNDIPPFENALLVGEGHGRFLASLLQHNPDAKVTCVDASASMLDISRRRRRAASQSSRIHPC